VFLKLKENYTSADYMRERAILSTTNEHVDAVNAIMIDRFLGNEKVYYSFDSVDDDTRNNYPLDFINSITPNGFPPHELKVKKDCPIILLLSHPFLRTKIGCIKDSCAPQETVAHIS
jgi:ATP-dependent DNA helicase PIF1